MAEAQIPDVDAMAAKVAAILATKEGATDNSSQKNMEDWLTGLLEGSLASFAGFLTGGFLAAIFALSATAPTWAAGLPYISALGGFVFGFAHGIKAW